MFLWCNYKFSVYYKELIWPEILSLILKKGIHIMFIFSTQLPEWRWEHVSVFWEESSVSTIRATLARLSISFCSFVGQIVKLICQNLGIWFI